MPRLRVLFLFALVALLSIAPAARGASFDLVVSQLFAGGGNSGASYTNDFVELFNRGTATVDLGGWSIQYASSSGTTWHVTPLAGLVLRRLLPRPARLGRGGRGAASATRRQRDEQPRGIGRQGRGRARNGCARLRGGCA